MKDNRVRENHTPLIHTPQIVYSELKTTSVSPMRYSVSKEIETTIFDLGSRWGLDISLSDFLKSELSIQIDKRTLLISGEKKSISNNEIYKFSFKANFPKTIHADVVVKALQSRLKISITK